MLEINLKHILNAQEARSGSLHHTNTNIVPTLIMYTQLEMLDHTDRDIIPALTMYTQLEMLDHTDRDTISNVGHVHTAGITWRIDRGEVA